MNMNNPLLKRVHGMVQRTPPKAVFTRLQRAPIFYNKPHLGDAYDIICQQHAHLDLDRVRKVFSLGQVLASRHHTRLWTFDGDGTLYDDGGSLMTGSPIVSKLLQLLEDESKHVAIVTAASYPGNPKGFENRLFGLLDAIPSDRRNRVHIIGGCCNYYLNLNANGHLVFDTTWNALPDLDKSTIENTLSVAHELLAKHVLDRDLDALFVTKPYAVGIVSGNKNQKNWTFDTLDAIALDVGKQLKELKVPICVFNGGNDVFIDIGDKSYGIAALQERINVLPQETLHFGDRFTRTGNDMSTARVADVVWVSGPNETLEFLSI